MQCKANLYFDFTINTCNWPQNVDCQTTIVTNDLEDDSEAPSPTDYKLQDDEKRFNVEGADSNAKKSYHDSYIKGVETLREKIATKNLLFFSVTAKDSKKKPENNFVDSGDRGKIIIV